MHGEQILNRAQLFHVDLQLFRCRLAHLVADLVHLRLHLVQKIKGGGEHLTHGHAGCKYRVLIQIAHAHTLRPFHLSLVRCKFSCNNIHEGGLSFAVCSDKSDVLTV